MVSMKFKQIKIIERKDGSHGKNFKTLQYIFIKTYLVLM